MEAPAPPVLGFCLPYGGRTQATAEARGHPSPSQGEAVSRRLTDEGAGQKNQRVRSASAPLIRSCGPPSPRWGEGQCASCGSWRTPWGTCFGGGSVPGLGERVGQGADPYKKPRRITCRGRRLRRPALPLSAYCRSCRTPWGTWFAWASMAWADWIRMLFLV